VISILIIDIHNLHIVYIFLRWVGHVNRRLVDSTVKRVDQMEGKTNHYRWVVLEKLYEKLLGRILKINEWEKDMVFDIKYRRCLIHIAYLT
jgi:hypothetical protein